MGRRAVGWYRAHLKSHHQVQPSMETAIGHEIEPQAIQTGDIVQLDDTAPRMRVVAIADDLAICEWRRRGRHGYELARASYEVALLGKIRSSLASR